MPRKESAHVVTGKMNGDRRKQRQKKKKEDKGRLLKCGIQGIKQILNAHCVPRTSPSILKF